MPPHRIANGLGPDPIHPMLAMFRGLQGTYQELFLGQ